MWGEVRNKYLNLAYALALVTSQQVFAAPGDILFEDDFESGLSALDWTAVPANTGGLANAGTNAYLVTTGNSLFTRHNAVTVTSSPFDLSAVGGVRLSVVMEKGADIANSEDPESANEDFFLEYLDSDDVTWVELVRLDAPNMIPQERVFYDQELPAAALHDSFRFRFRQENGQGNPFDYWHVDDVELLETTGVVAPPPVLSTNSCEYFENGLGNWTITGGGFSGTGSATSSSANNSMFLNGGAVTATSDSFDATNLTNIEVWIRKGADTFSEDPDGNEDLVFEYRNNGGGWIELDTYEATNGLADGQIVEPNFTPATVSTNFQVRFRLLEGTGASWDYWHIDDLCFTGGSPLYTMLKTASVESDPVSGTATDGIPGDHPKAIPNATVLYNVIASNSGTGSSDEDTLVISDMLSDQTDLYLGNLNGFGSPFIFSDGAGANASGLAYEFISRTSTLDEVVFLDEDGDEITPAVGVDYDPNVRGFRVTMLGQFNPGGTGATPTFTLTYRARLN